MEFAEDYPGKYYKNKSDERIFFLLFTILMGNHSNKVPYLQLGAAD